MWEFYVEAGSNHGSGRRNPLTASTAAPARRVNRGTHARRQTVRASRYQGSSDIRIGRARAGATRVLRGDDETATKTMTTTPERDVPGVG